MPQKGIKVLEVYPGSEAERIGLTPGDRILEIDGHEISDELALRFYLANEVFELSVTRKDGTENLLQADTSEQATLGVRVEEFKTRTCCNKCIFCFVDQLPPSVRPSLRIKDDDYRMSFLHGNYITLTNLGNKDISRIIEQRLSPLYLSVHATEADLRSLILGRKRSDGLIAKISRLVKHRIILHAQIVLMPGINDGIHLDKTVSDLRSFYPGVQSVAIVPLGLSDFGTPKNRLKPVTPSFCKKTILQVRKWQDRFRAESGETFVHLADEFYIQGRADIPETEFYDDFGQIEDGVGMVRNFLDTFDAEWKRRRKQLPVRGTLVTGKLFYPTLQGCVERFNEKFNSNLQVCMAGNKFLGRKITVAGLLAGGDILKALEGMDSGDFIIFPEEALSRPDGIFLDNRTPGDIAAVVGKPVFPGGHTVRDFFHLIGKLAAGKSA